VGRIIALLVNGFSLKPDGSTEGLAASEGGRRGRCFLGVGTTGGKIELAQVVPRTERPVANKEQSLGEINKSK